MKALTDVHMLLEIFAALLILSTKPYLLGVAVFLSLFILFWSYQHKK